MTTKCPRNLTFNAPLDLQAAAGKDDLPRIKLAANSGEPMKLAGFLYPVVIRLSGASFATDPTPIIADHDPTKRIGHTTKQDIDKSGINALGVVSSDSEHGRGFVKDAKRGFPFQVSVGAEIEKGTVVEAGKSVKVNGKTFKGPLIVAETTVIRELSILTLGADGKTAATLAANKRQESEDMELDEMTTEITTGKAEAESVRIDSINAVAIRFGEILGDKPLDIDGQKMPLAAAKTFAIQQGWDANRLELEARRADIPVGDRKHGPAIQSVPFYKSGDYIGCSPRILEAAIAGHAGLNIGEHYDEQTADYADRLEVCHIMDAFKIAAKSAGWHGNYSQPTEVIKAAFSTTEIATLLSNVAEKFALQAYKAFPSVARRVAKPLHANHFKDHLGLRLTGDATLTKLATDGTIKHGTLKDQSYSYSVDTYARMFGLDYKSIRNDDLKLLEDVRDLLGRGAAIAIEEEFWRLVIANTNNFFHTNNKNEITAALSSGGLAAAVQKFLEQVDTHGKPVGVVPELLVVPPALMTTGEELYVARTLNVGAASATTDDRLAAENVHHGRYKPLPCPWIGANGGLGGSDTGFYLFGSKNDVAAYGIAYLDGNESPKLEVENMPFNMLGVQYRGVLHFGCCQIDHRGAVRSTGVGEEE